MHLANRCVAVPAIGAVPVLTKEFQKAHTLVLGSSGRIGQMLRHAWAQDSAGIDFTFQTRGPAPTADLLWDILGHPPHALEQASRDRGIPAYDAMIILSGVVPGPNADFDLNSTIGAAGIAAAAHLGIGTVFLASTSAVYGTHQRTPLHETDPAHPVSAYGASKLAMETNCLRQAQALGVNLCCLRIGNVAGADALLLNARALPSGQKLALDTFADHCTPKRSYIGPQTFAQVLSTLVHNRHNVPQVLNIAAPQPVTMRALAEAAGTPFELHPASQSAHQYITLDCTTLSTLHRFAPADTDPQEMVRQWQTVQSA